MPNSFCLVPCQIWERGGRRRGDGADALLCSGIPDAQPDSCQLVGGRWPRKDGRVAGVPTAPRLERVPPTKARPPQAR
eukprot:scaffold12020_cov122-Isochrysis_galbana.AAC.15